MISSSSSSNATKLMADPSMTGQIDVLSISLAYLITLDPSFSLLELSIKNPASIILHDLAMFSAVSILSPVSIINLIPPCRRE